MSDRMICRAKEGAAGSNVRSNDRHIQMMCRAMEWAAGTVGYLCGEAGASVHDEGPELMAAGHRGDVQAVVVALLDVLVHSRVGHVVVVALLHGPVRVVDGDPLRRRQAQPDLLLGRLQACRRDVSGRGDIKVESCQLRREALWTTCLQQLLWITGSARSTS